MATPKLNRKNATADKVAATQQLKQFRHDLSILKRKGLVDKKYDARSQAPTKYLRSQLKRFAEVISGEKGSVKVKNKKQRAAYKSQGYEVEGERVLVPKMPGETVRAKKGRDGNPDFVHIVKGNGGSIERMSLRLNKTDIRQWIADLRANKVKVGEDEELMFQFFGNNNRNEGFGHRRGKTPQQNMADYLENNYPIIEQIEGDSDKESELIENIVIFKIKRNDKHQFLWPKPATREEVKDSEYRRRAADRQKRARDRRMGRMSDTMYKNFMEGRAEDERERRKERAARETPEQKEKRLQAARDRARASYLKKKSEKE